MRVGTGKEWRCLWALGPERCWNQLRAGQSVAWQAPWESVQALAQRLVPALSRAGLYRSTWPCPHSHHRILALEWQAPGSRPVSHQVKVTTLASFSGGNYTFPGELQFRREKNLGLWLLFWDTRKLGLVTYQTAL